MLTFHFRVLQINALHGTREGHKDLPFRQITVAGGLQTRVGVVLPPQLSVLSLGVGKTPVAAA